MVITFPLLTVTDDTGAVVTGATITITSFKDKAGADADQSGLVINQSGANVSIDYDTGDNGDAWVVLAISKAGKTFTGLNAAPAFFLSSDPSRIQTALLGLSAPGGSGGLPLFNDLQRITSGCAIGGVVNGTISSTVFTVTGVRTTVKLDKLAALGAPLVWDSGTVNFGEPTPMLTAVAGGTPGDWTITLAVAPTNGAPTGGDTFTLAPPLWAIDAVQSLMPAAVEGHLIDELDGQALLAAIVTKINATDVNLAGLSVSAIANASATAFRDLVTSGTTGGTFGAAVVTIFNKLPAGAIGDATAAAITALASAVAAVGTKTINLPPNPAATTDIPSAATIANQANTTLTASHGSGSWQSGAGGGGNSGNGDIPVDHNTGGTDALRTEVRGSGVAGVIARAYLQSDWDATPRAYNVQAIVTTNSDGRWSQPMMLVAGTYTITFEGGAIAWPVASNVVVS